MISDSLQISSSTVLDPLGRESLESDGARWHLLHVKSRQEKALARDLRAVGIDYFLPLSEQIRYHGLQKQKVAQPLFPGYLFLWGTIEQAYIADRTSRVANLIRVSDQARIEWELQQLCFVLQHDAPLSQCSNLVCGRRAEVREGPFRGLQGLILRHGMEDRLILGVQLLGQAVSLEIDRSLLDPIDEPRRLAP
ncbi:MAG TPA: transcription termination/antitermination NusG family protein [Tepidisphaeraceae bacterium]|nr:transcription termination/antitermination NusG family protein [Tepidisphaeraceae bacterium]